MVPDPPQQIALPASPDSPTLAAVREKVRVRFRKEGDLRLVSHRDLMKCFERMFRRAGLPIAATRGFNPRPRMGFPLALALGIVGGQEVVELELTDLLTPEAVHEALARQAPPGLHILSVSPIDTRLSGQPRRVCYRVAIPLQYQSGLPERIQSLLAAPECWIERIRPQSRRFDLRPFLRDLRLVTEQELASRGRQPVEGLSLLPGADAPGSPQSYALEIDLWVTPGGTARPEEILNLVGLAGMLDEGTVLERTLLELHDESPNPGPLPPSLPSPQSSGRAKRAIGPGSEKGASEEVPRPTSLVSGPMSFDT